MALNDNEWDDILAYLVDRDGPFDTPEEFVDSLKRRWNNVIDPVEMDRQALRAELRTLRARKANMRDRIDTRINPRIDELVALLNDNP